MKKKKLKKLLKRLEKNLAEKRKPARRKPKQPKPIAMPAPEILAAMQKVKRQLEDLNKPVPPSPVESREIPRNPESFRRHYSEVEITVADYLAMDRTMSIMQVHPALIT